MSKIHEQITEETWNKYELHVLDSSGKIQSSCLVGWMYKQGYRVVRNIKEYTVLLNAIEMLYPRFNGILSFNDALETTFDDVLRVLKVADL